MKRMRRSYNRPSAPHCSRCGKPRGCCKLEGRGVVRSPYTCMSIDEMPLFRYGLFMAERRRRHQSRPTSGKGANADVQCRRQLLDLVQGLRGGDHAALACILWPKATAPLLDLAFGLLCAWGFRLARARHWSMKISTFRQGLCIDRNLHCVDEPLPVGATRRLLISKNARCGIGATVRRHLSNINGTFEAGECWGDAAPGGGLCSHQMRSGWDALGNETVNFGQKRDG